MGKLYSFFKKTFSCSGKEMYANLLNYLSVRVVLPVLPLQVDRSERLQLRLQFGQERWE